MCRLGLEETLGRRRDDGHGGLHGIYRYDAGVIHVVDFGGGTGGQAPGSARGPEES